MLNLAIAGVANYVGHVAEVLIDRFNYILVCIYLAIEMDGLKVM